MMLRLIRGGTFAAVCVVYQGTEVSAVGSHCWVGRKSCNGAMV
jgi:hypothetical protein